MFSFSGGVFLGVPQQLLSLFCVLVSGQCWARIGAVWCPENHLIFCIYLGNNLAVFVPMAHRGNAASVAGTFRKVKSFLNFCFLSSFLLFPFYTF
jgi:hypothetical protein